MGKIIRNGIEFSSTVDTANNISYDNSLSGLEATTTQKAIDEVVDNVNALNESLVKNIIFEDTVMNAYQPYGTNAIRVTIPCFKNNPVINITNAVLYHPSNGWVPVTLNENSYMVGNLLTLAFDRSENAVTEQGKMYVVKLTGTIS